MLNSSETIYQFNELQPASGTDSATEKVWNFELNWHEDNLRIREVETVFRCRLKAGKTPAERNHLI